MQIACWRIEWIGGQCLYDWSVTLRLKKPAELHVLQGFYGVYEELFAKLDQQEVESTEPSDQREVAAKFGETSHLNQRSIAASSFLNEFSSD